MDKRWAHPSYKRLQKHCNEKCPTGKELRKVADDLDQIVKDKRKKKGLSA
ncbi:hypothetical protein [Paenibacillus sp. FSL R10-2734]